MQALQWLVVIHLSVFVVASAWAFGGQADWVRPPLTAWGAIGFLFALAAVLRRISIGIRWDPAYWWALPILVLNVIVFLASTNPSMRELHYGGETLLAATGGRPHWPSSAQPALSRLALLEFDAIWISCFNVILVLNRRRAIRVLLLVASINALVLAIFGTIQKLSHVTGIFFGAVPSPQKYFFSSFVYHNHWGAFALLMCSVCLALIQHYRRRRLGRDVFHSSIAMAIVVVLIIAATIPLSASRSSTLLGTVLLGGAVLHGIFSLIKKRRQFNESTAPAVLVAVMVVLLALAGIWSIAGTTIRNRADTTVAQVAAARTSRQPDQRLELYRDTWHMAMDKPWFGWGMASYPYVFTIYNTRPPIPHFPVFYHDAHSDWLQALAEHGVIGTSMLIAAAVLPLIGLRQRRPLSATTTWLFAGNALLVFYAAFEFPFGNYAVVLAWWLCFYCGVQYSCLADRAIDSSSDLRSHESIRPLDA